MKLTNKCSLPVTKQVEINVVPTDRMSPCFCRCGPTETHEQTARFAAEPVSCLSSQQSGAWEQTGARRDLANQSGNSPTHPFMWGWGTALAASSRRPFMLHAEAGHWAAITRQQEAGNPHSTHTHTHSDAGCYDELCGLMTDNGPDIIDPNSEGKKKKKPMQGQIQSGRLLWRFRWRKKHKKEKRLLCSFCSWDSKTRIKLRMREKKQPLFSGERF